MSDIIIPFSSRQIELLLNQHALVIHQGQKKAFNEANLKLSEEILEDIKGLIIDFIIWISRRSFF